MKISVEKLHLKKCWKLTFSDEILSWQIKYLTENIEQLVFKKYKQGKEENNHVCIGNQRPSC